ncbi:MAG: AraC family transcriptional regulator [Planctomycetota bacterium]
MPPARMRCETRHVSDLDQLEALYAAGDAHRFPVHCHTTLVIQAVVRGADWCCVNDLVAGPGEVFVHFPQAVHSGGSWDREGLEYLAIYPSLPLVAEIVGRPPSLFPTATSHVVRDPRLARLALETARAAMERPKDASALLKELLLRVVDSPVLMAPGSFDGRGRDAVDVACRHLREHSHRSVSLTELSEVSGVSRFHLIRKFRQRLGITPHQLLISLRVEAAKRLLAAGAPIAAAAIETGFADQSHLTRWFGRLTARRPGEYGPAAR